MMRVSDSSMSAGVVVKEIVSIKQQAVIDGVGAEELAPAR
jgi:hypothetical protein